MPAFTALDLESLLRALEGELPCGTDLEYDPAFLALEEAGAGKPEQVYGDMHKPAEPPDWPVVAERARALADRTRDLRVAVWLFRSGARSAGLLAALNGFSLVCGLIERWWDDVHPMLDRSDRDDPTARLSALAPLVHAGAGLADLRAAALVAGRGSLTVRQIELAWGRAEPLPGETVLQRDRAVSAVADAIAAEPDLGAAMQRADDQLKRLVDFIDGKVGSAEGVDFKPLGRLFHTLGQAAREATDLAPAAVASADERMPAAPQAAGLATIATRDDAVRALDRVCDWIEHNEPSNPAPLLIRRAKRLMSKSFLEIIRDLVPDGLDHVEKLAGIVHE